MSAVQTSVVVPEAGMAGMPADTAYGDTVTRLATEAVPFGVFVNITETGCELPDTSLEVTAGAGGITLHSHEKASGVGYESGDPVPVMQRGRVWVAVEDAVAAYASAFVRFSGVGDKGAFRSDADTANAVALPRARFVTATTGAGLAILEISAP